MEPIEVTARFDLEGKITPLSFTWLGRVYPVASVGRRWEDQASLHILVMAPLERVHELVFLPSEKRWFLRRLGKGRPATL